MAMWPKVVPSLSADLIVGVGSSVATRNAPVPQLLEEPLTVFPRVSHGTPPSLPHCCGVMLIVRDVGARARAEVGSGSSVADVEDKCPSTKRANPGIYCMLSRSSDSITASRRATYTCDGRAGPRQSVTINMLSRLASYDMTTSSRSARGRM